jgi:hypothetical protein
VFQPDYVAHERRARRASPPPRRAARASAHAATA